jgi:hypothetical protein
LTLIALAVSISGSACADWDNPTTLSELNPTVEFDIDAARVETLEEVEVRIQVSQDGAPMRMDQSQLEIHFGSSAARVVELDPAPDGSGYEAKMTFYEYGEHHLQVLARPERHRLMMQIGDYELQVYRQHRIVGPYWTELEVSPTPVREDSATQIRIFTYDMLADSSRGASVGGLDVAMEIHAPDGTATMLNVEEALAGEYKAEYTFAEAGRYELDIAIDVAGALADGEFHIPVLTLTDDTGTDGHGMGGQGDGH